MTARIAGLWIVREGLSCRFWAEFAASDEGECGIPDVGEVLRGASGSHPGCRPEGGHPPHQFTSARHLKCLVSEHDPIATLYSLPRNAMSSSGDRALRSGAIIMWREIAEPGTAAQRQGTAPGERRQGKAPRLRMAAIRQVDRTGPHRHGLVKIHRMQQHEARNGVDMGNVAYPCARLWNVGQSRCWVVKNDTEYTKCGHCTYRPASFF